MDRHVAIGPTLGPEFDAPEEAIAFEPVDSVFFQALGSTLLVIRMAPLFAILLSIWLSLSYAMRWLNYRHYRATGRRIAILSTLIGWFVLLTLMSLGWAAGVFFLGLPWWLLCVALALTGFLRHWLERLLPPRWQWLSGRFDRLPTAADLDFF